MLRFKKKLEVRKVKLNKGKSVVYLFSGFRESGVRIIFYRIFEGSLKVISVLRGYY